mmetsp:Transcript_8896/g.23072  ORF Transcript_8896/g.23072 Transcript_8896/m.23072 type:complete len:285 (-) Transcript_8896:1033-1887(-)
MGLLLVPWPPPLSAPPCHRGPPRPRGASTPFRWCVRCGSTYSLAPSYTTPNLFALALVVALGPEPELAHELVLALASATAPGADSRRGPGPAPNDSPRPEQLGRAPAPVARAPATVASSATPPHRPANLRCLVRRAAGSLLARRALAFRSSCGRMVEAPGELCCPPSYPAENIEQTVFSRFPPPHLMSGGSATGRPPWSHACPGKPPSRRRRQVVLSPAPLPRAQATEPCGRRCWHPIFSAGSCSEAPAARIRCHYGQSWPSTPTPMGLPMAPSAACFLPARSG